MSKKKLKIKHNRAPGDIMTLTTLIRDIHLTYPGEYEIAVDTSAKDLWRHNPYVVPEGKGFQEYKACYGAGVNKDHKERAIHFAAYWHDAFNRDFGTKVQVHYPYPDIHFGDREAKPVVGGRYWVLLSGGKSDFPIKVWSTKYYQDLVDLADAVGIQFVQVGSGDRGHWHPKLKGVLDLRGRTNLRDMARLVRDADGVVCGITFAMHLAAALQRPCVCIGAGREAWWWEAYVKENKGLRCPEKLIVPHRYLHTIGQLSCCERLGCWKNKVVQVDKDKSVCKMPTRIAGQDIATCMEMITPETVFNAMLSYYWDGTLAPPPGTPLEHEMKSAFTDRSYPAANPHNFSYVRSNGDKVTITIEPANKPHPIEQAMPLVQLETGGPRIVEIGKPKDNAAQQVKQAQEIIYRKKQKQELTVVNAMEGRGEVRMPAEVPAQVNVGTTIKEMNDKMVSNVATILDHPTIGGKFTLFVLMYGDYYDLHKSCLESIFNTVPAKRIDLRVGSNALCDESRKMVDYFVADRKITKHYYNEENRKKYPVMRDMFWDDTHPINTNYLIWFDDDTLCNKDRNWLDKLASKIVAEHNNGVRMFGPVYNYKLTETQKQWIKSADWYKNRMFQDSRGREVPNGDKAHFITGSFWALHTETMRKCNIPDPRIGHNGGDYMIGEQIHQHGFKLGQFSQKKQVVNWSSHPRRGLSEKHTGT